MATAGSSRSAVESVRLSPAVGRVGRETTGGTAAGRARVVVLVDEEAVTGLRMAAATGAPIGFETLLMFAPVAFAVAVVVDTLDVPTKAVVDVLAGIVVVVAVAVELPALAVLLTIVGFDAATPGSFFFPAAPASVSSSPFLPLFVTSPKIPRLSSLSCPCPPDFPPGIEHALVAPLVFVAPIVIVVVVAVPAAATVVLPTSFPAGAEIDDPIAVVVLMGRPEDRVRLIPGLVPVVPCILDVPTADVFFA